MIAEEQFPPQCEVDISDIVNVHMFGLNGEFLEGELKKAAELAYVASPRTPSQVSYSEGATIFCWPQRSARR